jgi:ParB family chromosome partitioning protein
MVTGTGRGGGNYGDDREHYLVLPEPEGELSADEQQRLDELYATQEATATYEDEAAIQVLIDETEEAASIRAWTPEQKAACGVVVSLSDGELRIQRGVQKKVQEAVADGQESTGSGLPACGRQQYPGCGRGYQCAASEKMSSERTLAVQAELVRQPQKAVALMVWRLCSCVFHYCITTRHPFVMNLGVHHSSLTSEAPTGENGQAWQSLMQEKARLGAAAGGLEERFHHLFCPRRTDPDVADGFLYRLFGGRRPDPRTRTYPPQ